ncbi:hypothetical protein C8Q77DRAFT_844011 [Trametes polyzona]|nr:hypothetical protein C8Q77DRAFT_844011 [Trametes polyzona]
MGDLASAALRPIAHPQNQKKPRVRYVPLAAPRLSRHPTCAHFDNVVWHAEVFGGGADERDLSSLQAKTRAETTPFRRPQPRGLPDVDARLFVFQSRPNIR